MSIVVRFKEESVKLDSFSSIVSAAVSKPSSSRASPP